MITLTSIKRQCRLEQDETHDDDYLLELLQDATEAIQEQLNRKLYPDEQALAEDEHAPEGAIVMPRSVRRAILMLISDLYENRSATSVLNLSDNPTYQVMLDPHRRYPNGH